MSTSYIFDTATEEGRQHVQLLEGMFDHVTTHLLGRCDLRQGHRCLDIGAGGGSVTAWLAEQTGDVVATDIDTDHLVARRGVTVRRHDINDGLPEPGRYDLIHARAVLQHLRRREEIFRDLVGALVPGGWLVLGEVAAAIPAVVSAPSEADAQLFRYMQHLSLEVVSPQRGLDYEWPHLVNGRMVDAGLEAVHGAEYRPMAAGGDAGCLLHRNLNIQAEPLLRAAGATSEELHRYRELMLDPQFRSWFYPTVFTLGRKPN